MVVEFLMKLVCNLGIYISICLLLNVYQAEYVPVSDPSLTEQYEYANEHDIKCLVIIRDTSVSQKDSVKVGPLT